MPQYYHSLGIYALRSQKTSRKTPILKTTKTKFHNHMKIICNMLTTDYK